MATIRVVLADDHDLMREGLRAMLETAGDIEIVGEAGDGIEVLDIVGETLPDVVLLDLLMPKKDGVTVTAEISDQFPNVAVVVLSGVDDRRSAFEAFKAGALGYLVKTTAIKEVIATIRAVALRQVKLEGDFASRLLQEFRNYQSGEVGYQPLTPRERSILQLIADGLPNKAIARRLSISDRTVSTHVANIYSKLHVNNRVAAVQEAVRQRLLGAPTPEPSRMGPSAG
jgi:DNA-binding NarL/FixJ family response regulator